MKHLLIRLDKEYNSTLVRVYGNIGMFSEAMGKFREMETCGIKINSKLQCNDWGIWKTTSILWLKNYLMTWKQDTKSYIIKYFIFLLIWNNDIYNLIRLIDHIKFTTSNYVSTNKNMDIAYCLIDVLGINPTTYMSFLCNMLFVKLIFLKFLMFLFFIYRWNLWSWVVFLVEYHLDSLSILIIFSSSKLIFY